MQSAGAAHEEHEHALTQECRSASGGGVAGDIDAVLHSKRQSAQGCDALASRCSIIHLLRICQCLHIEDASQKS